MSKRCELTRISPLKGHNVSHAKNKTKRRFLPNLKKVTFRSDILNKDIKINVANAALRTVDFKGGLDKFLLSAKNAKLSKKVKIASKIVDLGLSIYNIYNRKNISHKRYNPFSQNLVVTNVPMFGITPNAFFKISF